MKKKLLSIFLAAAMTLSLAGCSGSEQGNNTQSQGGQQAHSESGKKVGIAMPTQSLERWNRDGSYLDKQFKAAGYETVVTYSNDDTNQQVNDIQNMIAEKVDLLVIAAIDGEALNTVLNEAKDANIPVVSYDRLIKNDAISYYVSFDNYTVGKLQGEYVEQTLDLKNAAGPFNIEFTAGDPADNNAGYFFNGAFDVLKPYIESGKLNVVSGQKDFDTVATSQWKTDVALSRAQNVISSYYADGNTKIDAWLCSNDSTALGVAQAISSDYQGGNQPIITGQDGDEANLKNIVDGLQSMTVYKAVANEAVVTLELGKAILDGKSPNGDLITSAGWKFDCTYDTSSYETSTGHACPSFLLVPDVVTKDNMEEKLTTPGYYTKGDDGYLHPTN